MFVFYKKLSDKVGQIEAVYEANELTEEQKALGVEVDSIPLAKIDEVLLLNLETNEITVGLPQAELSVAELKLRLQQAEQKLQNPAEIYEGTNLNSVTLEKLKELKSAQLKYLSEKETEAGFHSQSTGFTFGFSDADQKNITNQMIIFLANPNASECYWKMLDESVQVITRSQFLTVLTESEAHVRKNINKLWDLNERVKAAKTKEAVAAIGW